MADEQNSDEQHDIQQEVTQLAMRIREHFSARAAMVFVLGAGSGPGGNGLFVVGDASAIEILIRHLQELPETMKRVPLVSPDAADYCVQVVSQNLRPQGMG